MLPCEKKCSGSPVKCDKTRFMKSSDLDTFLCWRLWRSQIWGWRTLNIDIYFPIFVSRCSELAQQCTWCLWLNAFLRDCSCPCYFESSGSAASETVVICWICLPEYRDRTVPGILFKHHQTCWWGKKWDAYTKHLNLLSDSCHNVLCNAGTSAIAWCSCGTSHELRPLWTLPNITLGSLVNALDRDKGVQDHMASWPP